VSSFERDQAERITRQLRYTGSKQPTSIFSAECFPASVLPTLNNINNDNNNIKLTEIEKMTKTHFFNFSLTKKQII